MKRLFWLVICFLMSVVVCGAPTYVTITYKVSSPTGSPPATLYATAQIVYDSSQNPIHTTFPVPASWNATTGSAIWSLPAGCYFKFVCNATGLNETVHIPDTDCVLNTLVPELPPPTPSWVQDFWSCSYQPQCNVDLGTYNFTANVGTFTSLIVGGSNLNDLLSARVPYTGAMANLDLGTFGLTTNSFKLSQAPYSDWILVSDNLGNGTWQNHKTAQWADMTDITDYTFFGSNSKPLKITGGVNIIGRTYEMRIGNEESVPRNVNTYRLVLSAEDNGFYGYSGAMVWEARPQGGGDIRRAEMWWFGNDGFGLQISDSINGDANYYFKSDGLYLEDGLFWNSNNDGRDSGLDADLLDGNHALDFEPALSKGNLSESTSSVLTITGGTNSVIGSGTTIQVKQASALQDGYLSKEDFATFNSKDGVVGNEVTDTADTTLTRTGTGASEDPYKLKLNLANANTFTANQTAPYFLQSSQYNPDNPRPYGFPQTSANALDDEFNDGNFSGWTTTWLSGNPTITEANGFVKLTGTHIGYIYKSVDDGDYRLTIKAGLAYHTKIGVAILKSDGTGYLVCLVNDNGVTSRKAISYKITKTTNNWDTLTAVTTLNYQEVGYIGLRYWNGGGTKKISWGTSQDGLNFHSFGYDITTDVPSEVNYIAIYSFSGGYTTDFMRGCPVIVDWFRVD